MPNIPSNEGTRVSQQWGQKAYTVNETMTLSVILLLRFDLRIANKCVVMSGYKR